MVRWAVFLFLFAGLASVACTGDNGSGLPLMRGDNGPATVEGQDEPPSTAVVPPIRVETDRSTYVDGESIIVTIANNSAQPMRFVKGCSLNLCYESGGDWICAERECEGSMTVVEPYNRLDIVKEAQSFDASRATDVRSRYKLDYYIGPERTYSFTHSNPFTVESSGATCKQAREIALKHARESSYWDSIDASRAIVRWLGEHRACVVDFAWQGAGQILPGMWSEGYYVTVGVRFGRIIEENAYVR